MANLLSVPLRVGRKRSGSFSEARSIARSLSTERPGTPRPTDLEATGHCQDSKTAAFKKPASLRESRSRFFSSMDSINTKSSIQQNSSLSMEVLRNSFMGFSEPRGQGQPQMSEAPEVQSQRHLGNLTDLSNEELMKMDFYSNYNPTSVTLSHFLDHSSGGGTVEDSFLFLRREIPVRIANIMKELELLPEELLAQPTCMEIINEYGQTFHEILQFENVENNSENHEKFNQVLTEIRKRHQDVVPQMANALNGLKESGKLVVNTKDRLNKAIQYFLDRLYMHRISVHMLIATHKSMFCPEESGKNTRLLGTIDPMCDPAQVAEEAYESAAFLCDNEYMDHPKLNIKISNRVDDTDTVNFVYIPSHLYHMFFEVFKNSMRATMEFHEDAETLPEIDVHIVKSSDDITIKISDQGGGISRSTAANVFLYLYTSADSVQLKGGNTGGTTDTNTPMHGLGYGLPLSKLYAKYFGGDIEIASCDGHGTDAYIYLKALETDARENLPIFNASSAARIKDTKNQVEDWTKNE